MKVCFETFGCRLNKAEALQQEAEYLARGWELTRRHADADLIIVRGCSVTARAQRDCEKLIAHLKRKYPAVKVLVVGCLKTTDQPKQADTVYKGVRRPILPESSEDTTLAIPTRTARAYLKVQDGCSGCCTFCIVPHFRGKSSSIEFTTVLDRARRMIDAGYHELVITGCNLSLYASHGKRLAELTEALAQLDAGVRIRVGSVEPGAAARDLVAVLPENANICRFLHLPIQSGANRILLAMKRSYLMKDVEDLINAATRSLQPIGLGCDLMTGFPGETDIDFMATKGLLERHPFSNVHVFPFSERPDTPAIKLPNPIPRSLRHERAHILSDIAAIKHNRAMGGMLGRDVDILIEDADKREGWTGEYFRCRLLPGGPVSRKSLVHARVTRLLNGKLLAKPL